MIKYALVIFAANDEVISTATLHERDGDEESVRAFAESLLPAIPQAVGYQLWSNGRCVFTTFPQGQVGPSRAATRDQP